MKTTKTRTRKKQLFGLRRGRRRKGITPVIAIILLLLMTVAAAGAAFLWIGKFQEEVMAWSRRNQQEEMRCTSIAFSVSDIHERGSGDLGFILRNSGSINIPSDELELISVTVISPTATDVYTLGHNASGEVCEAKALASSENFRDGTHTLVVCTGLFGSPSEGDEYMVKVQHGCGGSAEGSQILVYET